MRSFEQYIKEAYNFRLGGSQKKGFDQNIKKIEDSVILELKNKKIEIKLENEKFKNNELIKPSEVIDHVLEDDWRLPTADEMQEMIHKYEWECYEPNAVMYLDNGSDEIYWDVIQSGKFEDYGIYLLDDSINNWSHDYTWLVFADGVDPCVGNVCDGEILSDLGDFPCLVRLVRDVE